MPPIISSAPLNSQNPEAKKNPQIPGIIIKIPANLGLAKLSDAPVIPINDIKRTNKLRKAIGNPVACSGPVFVVPCMESAIAPMIVTAPAINNINAATNIPAMLPIIPTMSAPILKPRFSCFTSEIFLSISGWSVLFEPAMGAGLFIHAEFDQGSTTLQFGQIAIVFCTGALQFGQFQINGDWQLWQ